MTRVKTNEICQSDMICVNGEFIRPSMMVSSSPRTMDYYNPQWKEEYLNKYHVELLQEKKDIGLPKKDDIKAEEFVLDNHELTRKEKIWKFIEKMSKYF